MSMQNQLTHQDLAAAMEQFRSEQINPPACSEPEAIELKAIASEPPRDLIVLKDGSRALVGKHSLNNGTVCVLKYYFPKNIAKKINYGLRESRAMKSWIAARVFSLLDIPTPAAMFLYEQRGAAGITLKRSMLACHFAQGIPLAHVSDIAKLQDVSSQLQEAFSTMAKFRISHGDLKANNIIVDTDNKIRFIDLDGATILTTEKKWASLWQRDQTRFLRNWPAGHPAYQIFSETIKLT